MGGIEEELVQLIDILHKMVSRHSLTCSDYFERYIFCLTKNVVSVQGTLNASGQPVVKYGDFVKDPVVTNTFEAPFGILRSARKRKIVAFDGELLLSPVHDQVNITLLRDAL
jgi:hypothetical protein